MKAFPILKRYASIFLQSKPLSITIEMLNSLKKDHGLYFFNNTQTEKIDYIGTATGQIGIKGRVRNQHLSESYKKSVFRKKIMNEKGIKKEKDSINFIKKHYNIGVIYMPEHKSIIKAFEQILIFEYLSKYNSESATSQSAAAKKCQPLN